jgi:hypothetical protein
MALRMALVDALARASALCSWEAVMSDNGATPKGNSRRQVLIGAASGLVAALVAPLVAVREAAAAPRAAVAAASTSYGLRVVRLGPGSYYLKQVK